MTCVCNATYCDEFPPLGILASNQAAVYTTSISGKRFERTTQNFVLAAKPASITFTPNDSQKFQTIFGFGGAFTDASGINVAKLSSGAQQNFIRAYFGQEGKNNIFFSFQKLGIGYTVGRVPMASCDFSTHAYSYDDVEGDFNLTHFALTQEDNNYKIPYIKMAQNLIGANRLKLFASPWSAPGWMKTTGLMKGGGTLIGSIDGPYYQTWANYFLKFFEEYAKNGINFWGATMQNEPSAGRLLDYKWQAMYYNSSMERDFAKGFWGQTLRGNSLTKNLKLMVLDHNRDMITDYSNTVFDDQDAYNIVDGLGVHWYDDTKTTPLYLLHAHEKFPDKFLLYTEACTGQTGPVMGRWLGGDHYAHDIIQVLQNWVVGWTDWNMSLNPQGGPNWVNNFVDSPIIVSNTSDEFEKQTMYYALGHFSKFIVPDSIIIQLNIEGVTNKTNLEGIAAVTPSNLKVIVINNRDVNNDYIVSIINKQGAPLTLNLEHNSFTTVVYSD